MKLVTMFWFLVALFMAGCASQEAKIAEASPGKLAPPPAEEAKLDAKAPAAKAGVAAKKPAIKPVH